MGRTLVLLALALAAACEKTPAEEHRQLQDIAPPPGPPPRPSPVALSKIPGLAIEPRTWAARDCRLSTVLREHFGGVEVEPCGALLDDAPPRALEAARACVERAVKAGRPFVYEQDSHGEDSRTGMGLLGFFVQGKLVVHEARHDDNPCGGDCPERGHTRLVGCEWLTVPDTLADCPRYVPDCYRCNNGLLLADCVFGGTPPRY